MALGIPFVVNLFFRTLWLRQSKALAISYNKHKISSDKSMFLWTGANNEKKQFTIIVICRSLCVLWLFHWPFVCYIF